MLLQMLEFCWTIFYKKISPHVENLYPPMVQFHKQLMNNAFAFPPHIKCRTKRVGIGPNGLFVFNFIPFMQNTIQNVSEGVELQLWFSIFLYVYYNHSLKINWYFCMKNTYNTSNKCNHRVIGSIFRINNTGKIRLTDVGLFISNRNDEKKFNFDRI